LTLFLTQFTVVHHDFVCCLIKLYPNYSLWIIGCDQEQSLIQKVFSQLKCFALQSRSYEECW